MQLEEITRDIEKNYRLWAQANLSKLNQATKEQAIKNRIIRFIGEASQTAEVAAQEGPLQSVEAMLRLVSVANFRFGLLVGLLWDVEDEQAITPRCERCEGKGVICERCGESQLRCLCDGCDGSTFSPVACLNCEGQGFGC